MRQLSSAPYPPHMRPEVSRLWRYLLTGSSVTVQDTPEDGRYSSVVFPAELPLPVIRTASEIRI